MESFLKPEYISLVQEKPTNQNRLVPSNMQQSAESTCSSTGNQDEVSDSGSSVLGSKNNQEYNGLMRIDEDNKIYEAISKKFMTGFGSFGVSTQITAIHKGSCSDLMKQAKQQAFLLFTKAMEKKNGGNANVKYAWFGASKDQINNIFSHGFVYSPSNGAYANALCLSPDNYPLDCLGSAIADEDGTRHLVLCRVIMGRSEVVPPGSGQWHPSSEEYDTGVDNLVSPMKYIVWSTHMNTYVFPEFMVSFKVTSHVKDSQRNAVPVKFPNSAWITFPALIVALSKFLPPQTVKLIRKYHSDHKERKLTRRDLIQHVRRLAGDGLLTAIIKTWKNRQSRGSNASSINSGQVDGRSCACQKIC